MIGDGVEHLVEADAHSLGLNHDLLDLLSEQLGALFPAGIRKSGDYSANAGPHLEKAVVYEICNDLGGSVGIDLEFLAQRSDRWESVAWAELPGNHGLLRGIHHLFEERKAWPELNPKRKHSVYYYA